jgi:hypothetical protein
MSPLPVSFTGLKERKTPREGSKGGFATCLAAGPIVCVVYALVTEESTPLASESMPQSAAPIARRECRSLDGLIGSFAEQAILKNLACYTGGRGLMPIDTGGIFSTRMTSQASAYDRKNS